MKKISKLIVLGALQLGLVACATVPGKDELQQLDGDAIRSALVGNSITQNTNYGRWAEYIVSSDAGYAKASGGSWAQSVSANYAITDDGEWCATYSGPYEWAQPEMRYCALVYTDKEGNYYSEVTKNTYNSSRVGNMKKFEIKPGIPAGLGE